MSNRRTVILTIAATIGALGILTGITVLAFAAGRTARAVDTVDNRVDEIVDSVRPDGEFTRVGEVTVETITNLAELTTVEVVEYTTVEKGNDEGLLNWAVGDKIEMFAVARIGAGVDLSQLDPEDVFADPTTGRAIIRIPKAAISYVAVDNQRTHVYNRETGVFTKGDPDLERAARITAEEALVEQALADDILDTAERRAQTVLEDMLASLGYEDVTVVIADTDPTESSTP
ncbi:MAG: DUF4230 domain-containing protein [Acidimicrobiia bacterium]|nr:DUF4230 domain-containing protein [Acidimicrobiia bacterium]MDH5293796.1 DUF4230 domain-containing protein [Acidimicrobiia bacterium]